MAASGDPPQGVILILCDSLRRDHLDAYGYERPTAPNLKQMAEQGALFLDNQSQADFTKVSVPSNLSSLYQSTHGIVDLQDRLPSSAVTRYPKYGSPDTHLLPCAPSDLSSIAFLTFVALAKKVATEEAF